MTRTHTNFLIDAVALVGFALLTATGLVERYMLPPGSGHFQTLWNMNRHQWGEVHFWIAVVLMAALAVHLLLHWKWIVCVVRGRRTEASGRRVALGVIGSMGLVGLLLSPFLSPIEQIGEPGRQQGRAGNAAIESAGETGASAGETTADHGIRGFWTLEEVARATGVSEEVLIQELGLPADVPRDENLGRLRREYGFDMEQVRAVVAERSRSVSARP